MLSWGIQIEPDPRPKVEGGTVWMPSENALYSLYHKPMNSPQVTEKGQTSSTNPDKYHPVTIF